MIHKGWADRLIARQRRKPTPTRLSYSELVTQYIYWHEMWKWYRGYAHKPTKPWSE